MSLNKKTNQVQIKGKVTAGPFSEGSKSDSTRTYLETEEGTFLLRRFGKKFPFSDPVLKKLTGKNISVTGTLNGNIFDATDLKEIE